MEVVKIQGPSYFTLLDKDRAYFHWSAFEVKGPKGTATHAAFRGYHPRPVKVIPGEYL